MKLTDKKMKTTKEVRKIILNKERAEAKLRKIEDDAKKRIFGSNIRVNIYLLSREIVNLKEEKEEIKEELETKKREKAKQVRREKISKIDAKIKELKKEKAKEERLVKRYNNFLNTKKYLIVANKIDELDREINSIEDELKNNCFFELINSLEEMSQGTKVKIIRDDSEFSYTVQEYLDWDYYSKRYNKPKVMHSYTIKIGLLTLLSIRDMGLLCADGVVITYAKKIKKIKGVTVYITRYLQKVGQYKLQERNGKIGIKDGVALHTVGETFKETALLTLNKIERLKNRVKREKSLRKKYEKLKNVVLTIEDSIEAGNCQDGTESFIRKIGKDKITFWDLLELKEDARFKAEKTSINLVIKYAINKYSN